MDNTASLFCNESLDDIVSSIIGHNPEFKGMSINNNQNATRALSSSDVDEPAYKRRKHNLYVDTALANEEYVPQFSGRERALLQQLEEDLKPLEQALIQEQKKLDVEVYQTCKSCDGEGYFPVTLVSHVREDGNRHFFTTPANHRYSMETHHEALRRIHCNNPDMNKENAIVMCCCGVPSSRTVEYIPRPQVQQMVKNTVLVKRMTERDPLAVEGLRLFLRAIA